MPKHLNRVMVTTATLGPGDITLGAPVAGYQSFSSGGAVNGDVIPYVITEGNNWELGNGTYSSTGPTLVRNPSASSDGGDPISLNGAAVVFSDQLAAFFNSLQALLDAPAAPTKVAMSKLTAAAATALPNNTVTQIAFATVAIAGGFRGAGTPANGFIIPATGVSLVRFSWQTTISPINATASVSFRVIDGLGGLRAINGGPRSTGGTTYDCISSGPVAVAGGETFTMSGFQNGGGAETMNDGFGTDFNRCFFAIEDLTP